MGQSRNRYLLYIPDDDYTQEFCYFHFDPQFFLFCNFKLCSKNCSKFQQLHKTKRDENFPNLIPRDPGIAIRAKAENPVRRAAKDL